MTTELLESVLQAYANVDTEITELAEMLNRSAPPTWRDQFRDDLRVSLRDGSLNLDSVHRIMLWPFRSQQDLEGWFRRAWTEWFPGEPYPG